MQPITRPRVLFLLHLPLRVQAALLITRFPRVPTPLLMPRMLRFLMARLVLMASRVRPILRFMTAIPSPLQLHLMLPVEATCLLMNQAKLLTHLVLRRLHQPTLLSPLLVQRLHQPTLLGLLQLREVSEKLPQLPLLRLPPHRLLFHRLDHRLDQRPHQRPHQLHLPLVLVVTERLVTEFALVPTSVALRMVGVESHPITARSIRRRLLQSHPRLLHQDYRLIQLYLLLLFLLLLHLFQLLQNPVVLLSHLQSQVNCQLF